MAPINGSVHVCYWAMVGISFVHVKHENMYVRIQTQTRLQVVLFTAGHDVTVAPSGVSPAADEWPRCLRI